MLAAWHDDDDNGALTCITIAGQSEAGSNGNEEILHTRSSRTGNLPSDGIKSQTQDTTFIFVGGHLTLL